MIVDRDQFSQIVAVGGILRDLAKTSSKYSAYSSEFEDGILRESRNDFLDGLNAN